MAGVIYCKIFGWIGNLVSRTWESHKNVCFKIYAMICEYITKPRLSEDYGCKMILYSLLNHYIKTKLFGGIWINYNIKPDANAYNVFHFYKINSYGAKWSFPDLIFEIFIIDIITALEVANHQCGNTVQILSADQWVVTRLLFFRRRLRDQWMLETFICTAVNNNHLFSKHLINHLQVY